MATPVEKIKRLRLDSDNPFPDAYKKSSDGNYGVGKQGPLTEAIRAKRARQAARSSESSGRSRDSAMGSSENVSAGSGKGTTSFGSAERLDARAAHNATEQRALRPAA